MEALTLRQTGTNSSTMMMWLRTARRRRPGMMVVTSRGGETADAAHSKCAGETREGSNPSPGTRYSRRPHLSSNLRPYAGFFVSSSWRIRLDPPGLGPSRDHCVTKHRAQIPRATPKSPTAQGQQCPSRHTLRNAGTEAPAARRVPVLRWSLPPSMLPRMQAGRILSCANRRAFAPFNTAFLANVIESSRFVRDPTPANG